MEYKEMDKFATIFYGNVQRLKLTTNVEDTDLIDLCAKKKKENASQQSWDIIYYL